MDGALETARCGQAIVLQLADEIDVGRGSILTVSTDSLHSARALDCKARLALERGVFAVAKLSAAHGDRCRGGGFAS